MIQTSRRSFITGLATSLIAAPAIVRVSSLMPVRSLPSVDELELLRKRMDEAYEITRKNLSDSLYNNLVDVTRQAFVPRLFVQVYDRSPMLDFLQTLEEK